jgi:hypothetical protein
LLTHFAHINLPHKWASKPFSALLREGTFLKQPSNYLTSGDLTRLDDDKERLGRLPPNVKVAICIDMTETAVAFCAAGIRASNPGITDEQLVEKLRERLEWTQRHRNRENRIE